MPLGRQLSKLFNPGPAASYDPNREALFAQLLSSGAAPTNDVGSAIGNLAQFFVGSRGLKKQGQARDIAMDEQAAMEAEKQAQDSENLARVLSGLGVDVDSAGAGILQQNPNILDEAIFRSRPQEPKAEAAPRTAKLADGKTYWITGPDKGQQVVEGVEAPEAPEPEGKTIMGADGYNYWKTGPDKGKRVLPNVERPAPTPQATTSDNIRPTNLTMPDGSTRLVQTRSELSEAQAMGATLPQGGTQQRPMNEKQINAQLATDRMGPAMAKLFEAGVDGTLFETLGSAEQRTKAAVPLIGNFLTSEAYKKADNLIREVVGSGLRFETGAAITAEEVIDQVLRYAPRPGDTQGVIDQKKGNLINYLESISKAVPQSGNETAKPSTPESDPLGLFQ